MFNYQGIAQQAKLFYAMDQFPTEGASTLVDLVSNMPARCANTTTAGIPKFVEGMGDYSLSAWNFANTDASIQVPANTITATLGDISTTTGFSIGFWINLDYVHAEHIHCRVAGMGNVFDIMASHELITFRFRWADYVIVTDVGDNALDGTWQHFIVSLDYTSSTDNLILYQNGVATHTASYNVSSSFNSTTAPMYIGARGSGGNVFHGQLDDFIVFDEALDATTAQNLYANGGYQFCGTDGYPTKKAGGYTYNWDDYTTDPKTGIGERGITQDFTGAREIYHAPPIGIHPRVYFNPEEVFDLRERMTNLKSGQSVMRQIHAYTVLLHLGYFTSGNGGTYDHNAAYGKDDFGERWIDNAGFWDNQPSYEFLLAGDTTELFNYWDSKRAYLVAQILILEALECLINQGGYDPDTDTYYDDRARDLARAQTTWAEYVLARPDEINASNFRWHWFAAPHQGLIYDINYHMMTDEQRDIVRQAIAQVTPDEPIFGKGLSCYATTSNWSTLNSYEIIPNLAIEGEPGYKPSLTHDWMRVLHNFITYGWYDSGACFEGLGKNYQFATALAAFARRGYSLVGHPSVRAFGMKYLPAIMQPFGHSFTGYDFQSGSGRDFEQGGYKFNAADAIGMKWLYPNNTQTDFVWRNYISSCKYLDNGKKINSKGYVYQQIHPGNNYYNYMPVAVIFAQDYDDRDFDVAAADAVVEDYFAGDRGLAIMRSGVDSLSLQTQFHCRQNYGGHTFTDRNSFTMSGLGRIWVRKTGAAGRRGDSYYESMVMVNDTGVHDTVDGIREGGNCRIPGKIIDYQSSDEITTVTGDVTFAYTWEFISSDNYGSGQDHPLLGVNGWEKVTESWNDFKYEPEPEAIFNTSYYDFPNWQYGDKLGRYLKRPFNPMERVVRTAAMVRGENPFMLVVDDIEKDDDVHNYKWCIQIANDLTLDRTDVNLDDCDYRNDIILKEPTETGNRRLLVRVLNNEDYDGSTTPGYIDTLIYLDQHGNPVDAPTYERFRLVVESNSVAPDFKVLLYPHYDGDALPETSWNPTRDSLMVRLPTEERIIAFNPQEGGKWNKVELVDTRPINEVQIRAKAYLQGALAGTLMNANAANAGLLPSSEPFTTLGYTHYGGGGGEVMATNATTQTGNDQIMEWVIVELRDATNPSTIVATRAALLQRDGDIVDVDGLSPLTFRCVRADNHYHVAVRHRNHLGIMTALPIWVD